MKALFLLPFFLCLSAQAGYVSVQADHANFLYNVGQKANLLLHLEEAPTDANLVLENHIFFPGQGEAILSFEKGSALFISPELTAGEKDISIVVHLVNSEKQLADQAAISSTQDQISYWTGRLSGETNPQTIARIQEKISVLNAQLAALQADLLTADQIVQNIPIVLQVSPSGI